MEAGKLVEWMVKPGDTVKRGDVVAVVETQKGAIEIEIFEEGEVSELTAELGTELPVGAPLAVVLKPGEAPPAPEAAPAPEPTAAPKPAWCRSPNPPWLRQYPPPRRPPRRPGSPHARRDPWPPPPRGCGPMSLASTLPRSRAAGPGGVIVLGDVEGPARPRRPAGPETEAHRLSHGGDAQGHRRGDDAGQADDPAFLPVRDHRRGPRDPLPRSAQRRGPPTERILLGAVFVRAATLAASKVPVMNGHYTEEAATSPPTPSIPASPSRCAAAASWRPR
jgi:pyruvate dehydrogenase E2 component (dihydrolipoamide acetyltransferase)